MKNWHKILKFTLKQALRNKKYSLSTVIVGIVILIAAALTNIFVSGAFDDDSQQSDLKVAYIINNTDLSLDTYSFIEKNHEYYSDLTINEVVGKKAEDVASDPKTLGENAAYSLVLEITEEKESSELKVFIPAESTISADEAYDFTKDFSETVKNAKIQNTGLSEDKLNMAIGDINITNLKAEEADEEDDSSVFTYMAPMIVMLILYMLIIFYGQAIGQVVSAEKTSKLMEYILTLSAPSGLIFGKVTAVFCEALMQIAIWIACGFLGLTMSNALIVSLTGKTDKNVISEFMKALPEGGFSDSFTVILILAIIALLIAFLFYCFVSALFASFSATAEDVTQTNAMSLMAMLFGFMVSMYVPLFTDSSKIGMLIVRIIPLTAAFSLPADILCGRIGVIELILYLMLLIVFTVLLAILTRRVYKNRLFKKGTKGIFAEITAAITGKTYDKADESEESAGAPSDRALVIRSYENQDKAKKAYTVIGFAILAFILANYAIGNGLVGGVLAKIVAARKHADLMSVYEDTTFGAALSIISLYVIAFPICVLVMKFANESRHTIKAHITMNQYLRAIFMCFPVMYCLSYLSNYLAAKLSGGESENTLASVITSKNILAVIMVAFLAPIFEELIFRKLIMDRTRRYGELTSILLSSFLFGLVHSNVYQIFYAFALGLILGYVYMRTGNVILTIIMHVVVNSSSSIIYPLIPDHYIYYVYIMSALGIISIIYTLIKRDVKLEPAKYEVQRSELSSIAFFNPGVLIFSAVSILIMIYNFVASIA